MYASVISWNVEPPLEDAHERLALVRDLIESSLAASRAAGVMDMIAIEVEANLVMTISHYDTLDDAFVTGRAELVNVARQLEDRLALVSRVIGEAYDPAHFHLAARSGERVWHEDGEAMHAMVATWRLDSSLRAPAALNGYLADRMAAYLDPLKDQGLIDLQGIRVSDDIILFIQLYTEPISNRVAFDEAVAQAHVLLGDAMDLVKGHAGRAFDVPQLLGNRA